MEGNWFWAANAASFPQQTVIFIIPNIALCPEGGKTFQNPGMIALYYVFWIQGLEKPGYYQMPLRWLEFVQQRSNLESFYVVKFNSVLIPNTFTI